jgi:hypothetical protein
LFFGKFVELAQHLVDLEDGERYRSAKHAIETYNWPHWSQAVPLLFDQLVSMAARANPGP